jgi:hypothetical protein
MAVIHHAEVTTTEDGELETVNEYHILGPLGSGSFATVYCCVRKWDPDGAKYAVKVMKCYLAGAFPRSPEAIYNMNF